MFFRKNTFIKAWVSGMAIVVLSVLFHCRVEARPSIGLDLSSDPGTAASLVARITIVGDPGHKIHAAGLKLIYPADRVTFTHMDEIEGVVLNHGESSGKGILTLGLVDVTGRDRIELILHFSMLKSGSDTCIPMVITQEGLENDIKGASISPVRAYCLERPAEGDVWSNPDESANLFLVIPNLKAIKGVSIFYDETDITAAMMMAGSYFYDPLKDILYYILPGITIPPGQYPLTINWDYGQGQKSKNVTVVVTGSN